MVLTACSEAAVGVVRDDAAADPPGTVIDAGTADALVISTADDASAGPGDDAAATPVVHPDAAALDAAAARPDATAGRADAAAPDANVPPPVGDVHAGGAYHPDEDCTQYPFSATALLAELEGFGRNTTGGDPARPYIVTSLGESGPGTLRAGLESNQPYWIGFDVEGDIVLDDDGRIEVTSNKTVDGRGRNITIKGSIRIRDAVNVIFTDLKMENDLEGHCTQSGDVLPIGGDRGPTGADYHTRNIWINHMEIYNGGDGLIDLRGATDVTVSWAHMHTHKKGLLWSDPDDGLTGGGQHVTLHHSFFDRISLRGPQFIGGWLHFYNNYQFQWYEYGAGGLREAQFYSENNVYEARPGSFCFIRSMCADPNPCGDFDTRVSKLGLVSDWSGNGIGYTKSVGDLALEGAILDQNEPARVTFDPASRYTYTAEPADMVLTDRLRRGTGPRVDYCR